MDKELQELFYSMPPGTDSADGCLEDLDEEPIPQERVPKLLALMNKGDGYLAFRSAWLLCNWGNDQGFEYMRAFVLKDPPIGEGWYPHRLRNYDDTYRMAMDAFVGFWARKATRSQQEGEIARKAMLSPMLRIIGLSNTMPFSIDSFSYLISKRDFIEYLPALKAHLQAIIKEPEKHHWKVADCAHLLMKFDPAFVQATLAARGKTLADFPNK